MRILGLIMEKRGAPWLWSPLLTVDNITFNYLAENLSEDAGEEGGILLKTTLTDILWLWPVSVAERSETRVTQPEQNQAQIILPGDQ